MRYLLANSTKEDLVKHPTRWPGAHCAQPLCYGETDRGLWIDRTLLNRIRRSKTGAHGLTEADAEKWYELRISKLPCWNDLDDEEYRERIRELCKDIADEAAVERERTGRTVLGVKRILRFSPHHRPERLDQSQPSSPCPLQRRKSTPKVSRGISKVRCSVS